MTAHYTPEEYRAVMTLLEEDPRLKTFEEALDRVRGANPPKPVTKHKYAAIPMEVDGIKFASKAEARRYVALKDKEAAGLIVNLETHPVFHLSVQSVVIGKYVADFRYVDVETDQVVIEDVKGAKTPMYRWKKKHMKAQYGIDIVEIVNGKVAA